jgi:pimeloyl-ACP methyl ester carboxylesterase
MVAGMTRSEPLRMNRGNAVLVGEWWTGTGPIMVLLHAGVTDRRSWDKVIQQLPSEVGVIVYDRRGFGNTGPSQEAFSHVEDLLAVLDHATDGPVWLVGSSMGGGVALDTALTAPARVEGLVLLAPAVSGAPESDLDPDTARIGGLVERAERPVISRRSTAWRLGCGWTDPVSPRVGSGTLQERSEGDECRPARQRGT